MGRVPKVFFLFSLFVWSAAMPACARKQRTACNNTGARVGESWQHPPFWRGLVTQVQAYVWTEDGRAVLAQRKIAGGRPTRLYAPKLLESCWKASGKLLAKLPETAVPLRQARGGQRTPRHKRFSGKDFPGRTRRAGNRFWSLRALFCFSEAWNVVLPA